MTRQEKYQPKYSGEFKESLIKRMLPPESKCPKELALQSGVSVTSLKKWLRDASPLLKQKSKTKFQIVMETYALNEAELSAYARENGVFVEDIRAWQKACKQASEQEYVPVDQLKDELQSHKKQNKILEKELKRKEKALAETAALLVLSKKLEALWGQDEDA